jgi:hypothetical protein
MTHQIEVFLRHCYYSKLQEYPDRIRPKWFNKFKIFENFKNTLDKNIVNYTIVYDEFYGGIDKTFLAREKNVEVINCGSECESFMKTLDVIQSKNFNEEQIIYFLEDDYLHRPGWCNVLKEGFDINASYLTLYDFSFFHGKGYLSEIFATQNSHWRCVPATTNTFACKYKTLLEDLNIHKKYSSTHAIKEKDGFHFSRDYEKFNELSKKGKFIFSSIPGWSTHCEEKFISPVIDWKEIINQNISHRTSNKKFFYD